MISICLYNMFKFIYNVKVKKNVVNNCNFVNNICHKDFSILFDIIDLMNLLLKY